MFKNNLSISRIIGIAILGLTAMVFSVFVQQFSYISEFERLQIEELIILGLAFLAFATGLGLVFTQRWARVLLVVIMLSALGLWMYLVVLNLNPRNRNSLSLYGTTAFLVTFALSVTLVLYNGKVSEEFGDISEVDDFEDAMDSQLLEK